MKIVSKIAICLCLLSGTERHVFSQSDTTKPENPFTFGATYTGDAVANLSGGIKTGSAYLGYSTIKTYFDTQKAKLWQNGLFHIHFSNTHGDTPKNDLAGDFQGFSNIEAGNHTYLEELWYRHQIKNVTFIIGLQNMNEDFASCEHGTLFINSSFGIHSTLTENITSPLFPLTSPGLTINWKINEKTYWKYALYDGEPLSFEENPHNLNWNLNKKDGFLFVSEFQKEISTKKECLGTYRLGTFLHEHVKESETENATSEVKFGFYGVADQMIWKNKTNDGGLALFLQCSFSPQKISNNFIYLGGGTNLIGIGKRKNDVLGIAVAYAKFREASKQETVLEASYKLQINENLFLQPNFQYIINPSGTDLKIDHAALALLRFDLNF